MWKRRREREIRSRPFVNSNGETAAASTHVFENYVVAVTCTQRDTIAFLNRAMMESARARYRQRCPSLSLSLRSQLRSPLLRCPSAAFHNNQYGTPTTTQAGRFLNERTAWLGFFFLLLAPILYHYHYLARIALATHGFSSTS